MIFKKEPCQSCKFLESENARLHKIIKQLLDKVAAPTLNENHPDSLPDRPPSFEEIKDDDGKIVGERFRYGE